MRDNLDGFYEQDKAFDEARFDNTDESQPVNGNQDVIQEDHLGAALADSARDGQITSRPSRENILRSYASQDAERARNARMYSQAVSQAYRENSTRASERAAKRAALEAEQREQDAQRAAVRQRNTDAERARRQSQSTADYQPDSSSGHVTRVVPPLSTQESYDRTRSSWESYERARASRDALSEERRSRTPNREVIDGRGSIDSRAFNERNELVGYSIDERDKPQASVDSSYSDTRWHSRAGQGFEDISDGGRSTQVSTNSSSAKRFRNIEGGTTSSMGIRNSSASGVPLAVKIGVPIIVVLVIILIVVLVR